jgi:hypothetical protein
LANSIDISSHAVAKCADYITSGFQWCLFDRQSGPAHLKYFVPYYRGAKSIRFKREVKIESVTPSHIPKDAEQMIDCGEILVGKIVFEFRVVLQMVLPRSSTAKMLVP